MLQFFAVFLMVQFVTLDVSKDTRSCSLKSTHQETIYKDGDILIGGILQRSLYNGIYLKLDYTKPQPLWLCLAVSMHHFVQFAGFIYAVDEINKDQDILPNHTLGYQIFDSCSSVMKSLHSAMSILSNQREPIPNYSCSKKGKFMGIVGDLSSETSHAIAQLVGIYKFPQVSHGALDPKFSNKMRFPTFYRTVPNEFTYFAAIKYLLTRFGWTWVGILVSEDDSGEQALKIIKKEVAQSGGCVDFEFMIPTELHVSNSWKISTLFGILQKSTAQVFIIYSSTEAIENIFIHKYWMSITHKIWVASPSLNFMPPRNTQILNGSLMFSIRKGKMLRFQDFLCDVKPSKFPNDTIIRYIWRQMLYCHVSRNESSLFSAHKTFQSLDVSNHRFAYSAYTAVYTLAHALHAMLSSHHGPRNANNGWGLNKEDTPQKVTT